MSDPGRYNDPLFVMKERRPFLSRINHPGRSAGFSLWGRPEVRRQRRPSSSVKHRPQTQSLDFNFVPLASPGLSLPSCFTLGALVSFGCRISVMRCRPNLGSLGNSSAQTKLPKDMTTATAIAKNFIVVLPSFSGVLAGLRALREKPLLFGSKTREQLRWDSTVPVAHFAK